jgi:hypothetical protein
MERGQASQGGKKGRRIANKQKMSSLEWTDEAIESFSNIDLETKVSNDHENEVINDDMESKIARVQARKREADARQQRSLLRPTAAAKVNTVLTDYSRESNLSMSMSMTNQVFRHTHIHTHIYTHTYTHIYTHLYTYTHCADGVEGVKGGGEQRGQGGKGGGRGEQRGHGESV